MENVEQSVELSAREIVQNAVDFKASDILFLPQDDVYGLYFRKYFKLFKQEEIEVELGNRLLSYFKFQAALDIGDQRRPQSGAFKFHLFEQKLACRVSTLPSAFSRESLIIRLMYFHEERRIEQLTNDRTSIEKLIALSKLPQGLVLFTGPTGTGKSTTLYTLIQRCVKNENKHVITIEDPIEHPQENIIQMQLNEKAGLSYETGLKAILRHSPDVIMIGEIRERHTAKVSIEAALTGHLVFSTIHAKDTEGCLYRLLDLGISKEDLCQTVACIVSQKLIGKAATDQIVAEYEFLTHEQIQQILKSEKGQRNRQDSSLLYEMEVEKNDGHASRKRIREDSTTL